MYVKVNNVETKNKCYSVSISKRDDYVTQISDNIVNIFYKKDFIDSDSINNNPIFLIKRNNDIIQAEINNSGTKLGVADFDGILNIYDLDKECAVLRKLEIGQFKLFRFMFSPDDKHVAFGMHDLNLYDLENKKILQASLNDYVLYSLCFFNSDKLAVGTKQGCVLIYSLDFLKLLYKINGKILLFKNIANLLETLYLIL